MRPSVSFNPPSEPPARSVWWISDGKPGHLSQVRGLVNALRAHGDFALTEYDLRDRVARRQLRHARPVAGAPAPLIVGAGRRTHRPMLRAKRMTAGVAVVLMNPVRPTGRRRRGFDLYVVPDHDGVAAADDVILTAGALNPLTVRGNHDPARGVMLIGGPARRFGWNPTRTLDQLRAVIGRSPHIIRWDATSSRRTPGDTVAALGQLNHRITFTPAARTPRGWVADALAGADTAWVTEDSVSMVYEALSAGCRVGLLPVPRRRGLGERLSGGGPGRVATGVQRLVDRRLVTRFDDWAAGRPLEMPSQPFAEAERVAARVWSQWTTPGGGGS